MIAIDTNVVLRYALKDDAEQARSATAFLRDNDCLLLPTVVLEVVRVMSSKRGYGLDAVTVAERVRSIAGLPRVRVEQAEALALALDWYEAGMDFADALHLALAGKDCGLATLDKGIRTQAEQLRLQYPVVVVPTAPATKP